MAGRSRATERLELCRGQGHQWIHHVAARQEHPAAVAEEGIRVRCAGWSHEGPSLALASGTDHLGGTLVGVAEAARDIAFHLGLLVCRVTAAQARHCAWDSCLIADELAPPTGAPQLWAWGWASMG